MTSTLASTFAAAAAAAADAAAAIYYATLPSYKQLTCFVFGEEREFLSLFHYLDSLI